MSVSFDFSGKAVLVTGASQGIGLGIASAFASAGADVHVTGTRPQPNDYETDLSRFTYHQCRMDNASERARLTDAVPHLDVLVNNAGQSLEDEYTISSHDHVIDVNLTAVSDLCFRFHDRLVASRGAIVNIGSVSSYICVRDRPAYTASKHAIAGLTKALADKWAKDVRVNMVAPGFIDTRIVDWARNEEGLDQQFIKQIPARRIGQPSDVANAVLFLGSEAADYIRGHGFVVDGGYLLR
ncbi:MAG: SDR family oxidoreductase [Parvibaculaceae bacterium]